MTYLTLYLLTCQVRLLKVTHLFCCVFVTSFELHSTPLCVDFVYSDLVHDATDTQPWAQMIVFMVLFL